MKSVLSLVLASIALFLVTASCGPQDPYFSAPTERPEAGAPVREVIFFTMTSDELFALVQQQGGDEEGVLGGFDEFESFAVTFMEDPQIEGLRASFNTDQTIVLAIEGGKEWRFTRGNDMESFGAIFYDGVKQPRVVTGIHSDESYRSMAREYFGIR